MIYAGSEGRITSLTSVAILIIDLGRLSAKRLCSPISMPDHACRDLVDVALKLKGREKERPAELRSRHQVTEAIVHRSHKHGSH